MKAGCAHRPSVVQRLAPVWSEALESRVMLAVLPAGYSETVITGFSGPTAMEFAPDGRLFVTQQNGVMRVIKNNVLLATPFFDLNVDSAGERGLLGIAFDPDFNTNKHLYVYYTVPGAGVHNRVSRFTANGDVVLPGSEVVLLELPALSATNHNGGAIHFGTDGKLYIAVGDNAVGSNAQSKNNILGKMLRMNKDGSTPTDNPFFNDSTFTGKNKLIYNMGLRNPFTFAIQPVTNRIFVNDVGQNTWEEINDSTPGVNFGWPGIEGPRGSQVPPANYRDPLFAYRQGGGTPHPSGASHPGGCAIAGGTFYNPAPRQFPAGDVGDYFYADLCGGYIRKLDVSGATPVSTPFATGLSSAVDLKVSPDGALYYLQRGGTALVGRIVNNTAGRPGISAHPASQTRAEGSPVTFSVTATGTGPFTYQWLRNGVPIPGATSASYIHQTPNGADNGAQFRAMVSNAAGGTLSNPATLTVTGSVPPVVENVFLYTGLAAAPHIGLEFSENVGPSFGIGDFHLRNLTTGATVSSSGFTASYSTSDNIGRFSFQAPLPNGVYELTLLKDVVNDAIGNPLAANVTFRFLMVNSTAGANALHLRVSGGNIQGFHNVQPGATPTYQVPLATGLDHVFISNSGGSTTFTYDISGGAIPVEVVEFYSDPDDVLRVIGSSGNDTVVVDRLRAHINGQTIEFRNTLLPRLSFDGVNGTDSIELDAPQTIINDLGAGAAQVNLSLVQNANITLLASQHLGDLDLATGTRLTLASAGNRVIRIQSLDIAGTGRLDLKDNWMVIESTPAERIAELAEVNALLESGLNAAALFWTGNGITSSTAAADPNISKAVGAIINDYSTAGLDVAPVHETFQGAVGLNDILIRYTAFGDADLNGIVDGGDYFLIDNAFSTSKVDGGWLNGDFDYNGIIDGGDYFLIDNAYAGQSPAAQPLAAQPLAAPAAVFSAVRIDDPEADEERDLPPAPQVF